MFFFQMDSPFHSLLYSFKYPLLKLGNFIEIGILPKLNKNLGAVFTIAITIAVDNKRMVLNEQELANLLHEIRKHPMFDNTGGEDVYLDDVINDFDGAFRITERRRDWFEIIYMSENIDFEGIGNIHISDINEILLNEIFLNNQLFRIHLLIDKCHDDLVHLANIVNEKKTKIFDLKEILKSESRYCGFAAEMLANHFDFFSMCNLIN